MIDQLMLYCFSVAALVSVAAFAGEHVVAALGWPRRVVWAVALVLSIGLPLFMIANSEADIVPEISSSTTALEIVSVGDSSPALDMPTNLPSVTSILQGVWALGSVGLLVFGFVGWLRLRFAARKWGTEVVEGTEVQVADNLGPAVVGFFNPKIVVPRWLLAAAVADRSAAIAHERSHIAARDSLLLLLGLLLVALTPWNLPMWWQLRKLRFAIEVDCDQRVLSGGASVDSYGEMLLAVGQRNSRTPIGAIALTEPASQLERRIRIMTNGSRPIKLLVLIALAMSGSMMAVAAQLDAPPLSSIAPAVFSLSAAAHENSQAQVAPNVTPGDIDAARTSVAALDQSAASVVNVEADATKTPTNSIAPKQRTKAKPTKLAAADPVATKPQTESVVQKQTAVDKAAKRIYTVQPVYPEAAKLANIPGGLVDVAFTVAVTGDAQDAKVVKSEPADVFDEAALAAVRQWRFEPAIKDGQAVPLRSMIRLRFEWPSGASAYTGPSLDGVYSALASAQRSPGAAISAGETLDMTFTEVDIRSVLKFLADASGQNMVVSDKVSGKITLKLMGTPREEALDMILRQKNLVKRQQGGIIFIEPAPAPTAL